ncbi:MAG: hypothetical protein GIX02_12840 [Candidatus Eremiobacteraeota bacterium]|nr:hypothetical protein [Candidatus Eremiobacteraeota bacterium]
MAAVRAGLVRVVAPELLADEHIRVLAAVLPGNMERLLADHHTVVEARDEALGVPFEIRVAVCRIGGEGALEGALEGVLLGLAHPRKIVVEGAGVAEDNVDIAIGPHVSVVALRALQVDIDVLHRVRRRRIKKVPADGIVGVGELPLLSLLRPRFELRFRDRHANPLRSDTSVGLAGAVAPTLPKQAELL